MKKLSLTRQWELEHPDDEKCPTTFNEAQVWRRAASLEYHPPPALTRQP